MPILQVLDIWTVLKVLLERISALVALANGGDGSGIDGVLLGFGLGHYGILDYCKKESSSDLLS